MNKAEIKEFLNETKVYVNGKSEKIQEKLFSLGCLWIVDDNPVIQDVGKPFIFIDKGLKLTNGDDMLYFEQHRYREITAEEILALDPPSYRPFKNHEEYWNEMLKHQPFGWIKSKDKGYFYLIGLVQWESELEGVMITFATSEQLARSSRSLFEKYIFADGTPFGVKEE